MSKGTRRVRRTLDIAMIAQEPIALLFEVLHRLAHLRQTVGQLPPARHTWHISDGSATYPCIALKTRLGACLSLSQRSLGARIWLWGHAAETGRFHARGMVGRRLGCHGPACYPFLLF